MAIIKCPICDKSFDREKNDAVPFCSTRCQQVDLSRWFGEVYSVPYVPSDDELDEMLEENEG